VFGIATVTIEVFRVGHLEPIATAVRCVRTRRLRLFVVSLRL